MDLSPLRYRVERTLLGRPSMAAVCERRWALAPASVSNAPPALYLPGELDKVAGYEKHTSPAREMTRIRGGRREHAATVAYRVAEASIVGGSVYKGRLRRPLALPKRSPWMAWNDPEELDEAVLACTLFGGLFFAHWVTDDLTLEMAAAPLGEPLAVRRARYGHEPAYRHLLHLEAPRAVVHARCRSLTVIEDPSQNRFKRRRYEALRQRLRSRFPPAGCRGVMLRRGSSGQPRLLVNEDELASLCMSRGFAVLDPQTLSVDALMQHMMGAKVVLGVEGSQLTHGFLAVSDDGGLLALQPPHRFNNHFKDYTDCLDLGYGFVVGTPAQQGFRIAPDDLSRTLDLFEARP